MRFEDCIDKVLEHEGGYVNDPNDLGGETNFGVSKKAYPDLDIKNLTRDEAKEIYRKDYWERYKIEKGSDSKVQKTQEKEDKPSESPLSKSTNPHPDPKRK